MQWFPSLPGGTLPGHTASFRACCKQSRIEQISVKAVFDVVQDCLRRYSSLLIFEGFCKRCGGEGRADIRHDIIRTGNIDVTVKRSAERVDTFLPVRNLLNFIKEEI